jgi:hypothetical protein
LNWMRLWFISYSVSVLISLSIWSILIDSLFNNPKLFYFTPCKPWIIGFDVSIDSIKGKSA